MYVREHAKRILRSALVVDTQFLESLNVMDYSLIVAVDQKKNEVVVGLVGKFFCLTPIALLLTLAPQRLHSYLYLG
jgi:hypothetical protein